MSTRRLSLRASDLDEISGYEAMDNLTGARAPSFQLSTGRPLSGRPLDKRLEELGQGIKVITAEGVYQPEDQPPLETLPMWSRRTEVAGRLDAASLGRIVAELTRRFRDAEAARLARRGLTGTPPLIFVRSIILRTETAKAFTEKRGKRTKPTRRLVTVRDKKTGEQKRVVRRQVTFYYDTETGRRVSESTWKRSRAALRARTPKGQRAKPGRYKRVTR